MGVKCFMVEKSGLTHVFLRRYAGGSKCSGPMSYHDYEVPVGLFKTEDVYDRVEYEEKVDGGRDFYFSMKESWNKYQEQAKESNNVFMIPVLEESKAIGQVWPSGIAHWPTACSCGYLFQQSDEWQIFAQWDYTDSETKTSHWSHNNLPVGSMYFDDWMPKKMYWDNKEDAHLIVKLPDGTEWNVDSRANNCTLPDDRTHRCWVREGIPPVVTAGKAGHTCTAGAGSILTPRWHGFLTNGELNQC